MTLSTRAYGALAAAGGAVLLLAHSAKADVPEVQATLTYELARGAEACPAERTLREQVALRLGYDPFHDDAPHRVTVRIAPRRGGLKAVITTEDPSTPAASRELESEGDGCEELVQSVVLAVSLAIDPLRFAGPPRPKAVAPPPTPERPAPERDEAPAQPAPPPPPPPPLRTPWNVEVSASGRLAFDLVPGPVSLGPVVDLRVGKKSWALEAEAGADLPTGSTSHVSASMIRGGVGACATPWWLLLCARTEVAAVEGTGSGGTTDESFYLGVAAAAGIDAPLVAGIRAVVLAEVIAPITRTTLHYADMPAWSTPTLAGAFSAGLGYRF